MGYGDKKTEGGHASSYPGYAALPIHAAPSHGKEKITLREELIPVGCWKIEDLRFLFDSSMVLPDAKPEFDEFAALKSAHPGSPLTMFGHADPVGDDDYNKALSGRRVRAVYAVITRNTDIWETLYNDSEGTGDDWHLSHLQIMLKALGFDPGNTSGSVTTQSTNAIKAFQSKKGLEDDGDPGKDTRKELFKAYMDFLCPVTVAKTDFLGRGEDAGGKADYQGCSEFNPQMMFSADENTAFANAADKTDRNAENSINRRVMALLFRPGTKININRWPCPRASEGTAGCVKRLWADAATRRQFQANRRTNVADRDTFACRFYDRLAGASPCEGPVQPVEPKVDPCPADFVINAPCRILKVGGGAVQMSATEMPGIAAGTYTWTTASAKITLTNANTATVTVTPLANPSASRDDETITVTRTAAGCPDIVKTVKVTVAKVTFSAAATQRYGHDDFDTPADPLDDHICIKKSDHTFLAVVIEGGALGTDFNFTCDHPIFCTAVAPGGTASFDLRLDAGPQTKDHTTLHAKVKCPGAASFAHIDVRVYKEKEVDVVVAKIHDSTVAATKLNFDTADYASHAPTANAKLKEAVVKFNMTNYDAANAETDVRYDLDGNGAMSYDIGAAGGRELDAIKAAMTGTGTKVRVAIIRNLRSFYYLSAAAAIGDTTITVTAGRVFDTRTTLVLGTGASAENVKITSIAGSTITLTAALTKAHASGASLEYMAGGWGADPILITEGAQPLLTLKWTVLHEVGHRALALTDIDDQTDFMHYDQGWTDYRLRYCPRTIYRGGGTENQWETIPR